MAKNRTYEPYRNYLPPYNYSALYHALANSGAKEYEPLDYQVDLVRIRGFGRRAQKG